MKKGLLGKRIPAFLVFLILLIVVVLSISLVKSGIFYIGKAAPDTNPQNFSITNLTDSSFTVTFSTKDSVEAVIALPDGKTGNKISLDDRDKKTGIKNPYFSHHISVFNLDPQREYAFKIIAGKDEYDSPEYKITTGTPIQRDPPAQNPLYGKVLDSDGLPAYDAFVTAKTAGSQTVSWYTNNAGEFIIPTNSLRNADNNDYVNLSDISLFELQAVKKDVEASVSSTFRIAQNLPSIYLSENYVFKDNSTSSNEENLTSDNPQSFSEILKIKKDR